MSRLYARNFHLFLIPDGALYNDVEQSKGVASLPLTSGTPLVSERERVA